MSMGMGMGWGQWQTGQQSLSGAKGGTHSDKQAILRTLTIKVSVAMITTAKLVSPPIS